MKNFIFAATLLFTLNFIQAQSVEVQGQLKITTVNQNNAGTDVLVRNPDGTVAKRDASIFGGALPGTAGGDVKYWDGANWTLLPIGSPGQTLHVSSSNIPQWQNTGKTYVIIKGDITNAQAAAQIAEELGSNTQFIEIRNTTILSTLDLSGCTSLIDLNIGENTSLATVNVNGLIKVTNINIAGNPVLTTLSFPALITNRENFYCVQNPSLTTLSLPALATFTGGTFAGNNNAFASDQINDLLATFVSLGITPLNYISVAGQTPSAPPTGQGITDKMTLETNGKTVLTD